MLRQRGGAYKSVPKTEAEVEPAVLEEKEKKTSTKFPEWTIPLLLTLLSFVTRFYALTRSNKVVWDEAHFGKFASYYLRREFYHDVHPPLGKILLGFSGALAGYNGTFKFKSGSEYPSDMSFGVMRAFCAFFGALLVPLAYLTCKKMRLSTLGSSFAAFLVLTDLALLNISRFILLDSLLLFFTALVVFAFVCFRDEQVNDPFSPEWWLSLYLTGVSLGCVLSVKWVGLFAIALVGIFTLEDLWTMFGDLKLSLKTYAKHWIARIVFLILLPATIYIASFKLHFYILNRSGDGDAQMSSLFQASLLGNSFASSPLQVAYESKVSIKNNAFGGGLLHSHVQKFPGGSEQQQVTCYHHKDNNNEWIMERPWDAAKLENVTFVKNGDIIRLVHAQTGKNLHSHSVEAPITKKENEVSGYGSESFGDSNDLWKVEIASDTEQQKLENMYILTTKFRLRHVNLGCYLMSHSVNLPEWGFKQAEVVCKKKLDSSRNLIWNVEQHWNSELEPSNQTLMKTRFFNDFIDLNVGMWTTNNALTPDPDKEPDDLTSEPYHWPLLLKGLRMCGWDATNFKFYLIGNPLIWWGSTFCILVISILGLVYAVRHRRKYNDSAVLARYQFPAQVALYGWVLHYLPFWIMGRVTYLHHYFPALYFAILGFAFVVEFSTLNFGGRKPVFVVLFSLVGLVYFYFSPFAFGFLGEASEMRGRRWLQSWNIYNE